MPDRVALALEKLLAFAEANGLIAAEDRPWAHNLLLDVLGYAQPFGGSAESFKPLGELPATATAMLEALCDDAVSRGVLEDSATRRELFSARLMGLLTPPPSAITDRFAQMREHQGIQAATDWFYALQRANDYIRVDAIARNRRFVHPSIYGPLEITINLSKPEKDPRDIAALRNAPQVGYPKCLLCIENQGYAGRLDFPARQTLRMLPLELQGERWYLQYSPYLYYPEHCIVLNHEHRPMAIARASFARLFDFVEQFPHYFVGSNADLPIVGGSILNHDHFQGGRHSFPMQAAPVYARTAHPSAPGIRAELIAWPMTTLRLRGDNANALCDLADHVLHTWRGYSDEQASVLHETEGTPHNTITPIARRDGRDGYTLDLVLRNNRTTAEHPLGIFHPHAPLHHIKKENIGLIEVMGLFILPGRLIGELDALTGYLTGARSLTPPPEGDALEQHWPWISGLAAQVGTQNSPEDAQKHLQAGLTEVCAQVLHDSGVFKLDDAGAQAMGRFLHAAGFADITWA